MNGKKLQTVILVFIVMITGGIFTLFTCAKGEHKGPQVDLYVSSEYLITTNEETILEGVSSREFFLENGEITISSISSPPPLGWDGLEYWYINTNLPPGSWAIRGHESQTLRLIGSPSLVVVRELRPFNRLMVTGGFWVIAIVLSCLTIAGSKKEE
jgi:hypothetical protein